MNIIILDQEKLSEVRQYWLDYAVESIESSKDTSSIESEDDSLELLEQFFDFSLKTANFGDYLKRENLSTHIGVDIDGDGKVDALVEIIYHRRGRSKTIKIMNFYYSPSIEKLTGTEYDTKVVSILSYVVNEFIQTTHDTRDGATKIYSQTDASLHIMNQLHEIIQSYEQEFKDLGIGVKLEGKRWLAFRKI